MSKAQEIADYIADLYGGKSDLTEIQEENLTKAFEKYDLEDIKHAVNEYWTYKNSKTKPNVAQILALLDAHKTEKLPESDKGGQAKGDVAIELMKADVEAGTCRNNLYVYYDAVDIVINKWLLDEMPVSVWSGLSYGYKIKQAENKGLFDRFDEALRESAQARFGRDYEFPSKNDMKNMNDRYEAKNLVKSIASHWRAD